MSYDPDDWNPLLPQLDVPEHKPRKTGILDVRGKMIKRPPPQIGFHRPQGNPRG